jgi:uncharacterized protein YfaS (alpha-2-macroglobulin family)
MDATAEPNTPCSLPIDLGTICRTGAKRAGRAGIYAFELLGTPSAPAAFGTQGDGPARVVANVTDLGVIAKRGEAGAVVWVTKLSNAALVSNATAELWSAQGVLLGRAQTDERGLARFANLPPRG